MKKVLLLVVVLAAAGGVAWWFWKREKASAPQYRTAMVQRGDVLVAVTATGTIQPLGQVQVGTQVSGTIESLGADWNSAVTTKTVLAQIDPAPLQARADQDRANLARAEADVERVQAALTQAENDLKRAQELAAQKLIPPSEYDAAVATRDSQVAQMKVARAGVEQSRATLRVSELNLKYTTIYSPIDGIVISRNVDVGQTVAASLSAPTLFVIAENLKSIQVQASVAEADIGRIFAGQDAMFTVDAYRERRFRAKVVQVRLQPTTVQNVVTYTVILGAENKDEKLLPGMTANVTFEVETAKDVLKVPNAALRFVPADAPPAAEAAGGRRREAKGRVWVKGPAGPVAVEIETGVTDGSFTAVKKGELTDGQEVITGLAGDAKDPAMSNPFAPTRGMGRGR
ncbi:MAG: efflux RND transporter periplasmic adaptor subunit [Planctomycetes bacterium]|nr:efflux RND transporter periplasmic adaptor subunit [Planctomycetota bacterium]